MAVVSERTLLKASRICVAVSETIKEIMAVSSLLSREFTLLNLEFMGQVLCIAVKII